MGHLEGSLARVSAVSCSSAGVLLTAAELQFSNCVAKKGPKQAMRMVLQARSPNGCVKYKLNST